MDFRDHHCFVQTYRCYPHSHLEAYGNIIMPASALHYLANRVFDGPLMFELLNLTSGRTTHCGVQQFDSEEGRVFMPNWMMEHMTLQEGELVKVKSICLEKGTYVKLQPHTKDFLALTNPRSVLETTLRNFFCLTKGDTIMIMYNNKKFYIDVLETGPSEAISIFETDCEVDFAPPLDYQQPERPVKEVAPKVQEREAVEDEVLKCKPFSGVGRCLDGKVTMEYAALDCSTKLIQASLEAADHGKSKPTTSSLIKKPGKLVFGSNFAPKEFEKQSKDPEEVALEKGVEKVQPFTGRSFRLREY